MPDHAGETSEGVADHAIKNFLNQWKNLPEEGENCPPVPILLAVSKEDDKSKWRGIIREAAVAADEGDPPPRLVDKWYKHIDENCEYCTQIMELLQNPQRPAIPMGKLLAEASMEAQRQKAAALRPRGFRSELGGLFSRPHPGSGGGLLGRASRLALPLAAVVVLVVWGAGSRLNLFKNPDEVGRATYERSDARLLARGIKAEADQLKEEVAELKEKKDYVLAAEYNQEAKDYNENLERYRKLEEQRALTPEDHGELAAHLALYQGEIKQLRQLVRTSDSRGPSVSQLTPPAVSTLDAEVILKSVGEELIKKKSEGDPQTAPVMTDAEAVRSGFENVGLKFIEAGDGFKKIEVVDKKGEVRPPVELEAIRKVLQETMPPQGFVERSGGRPVQVLFQGTTMRTIPAVAGGRP